MADLDDSSPAGTIYGESLANALAVYLVQRYAVRKSHRSRIKEAARKSTEARA